MASILLVLLTALLCVRTASAHADVDRSDPPADATLTEAPTQVRIWFTQELFRRQGQNSMEVQNAAGQRVDLDDATIDDDDRTLMTVALASGLTDGVYLVHWRTTSAEDGHEGEGEFTFTLAGEGAAVNGGNGAITATNSVSNTQNAAQATAIPTNLTAATAPSSSSGGALPCANGALPFVLIIGAVWMRRRQLGQ